MCIHRDRRGEEDGKFTGFEKELAGDRVINAKVKFSPGVAFVLLTVSTQLAPSFPPTAPATSRQRPRARQTRAFSRQLFH